MISSDRTGINHYPTVGLVVVKFCMVIVDRVQSTRHISGSMYFSHVLRSHAGPLTVTFNLKYVAFFLSFSFSFSILILIKILFLH